MTEYTLYKWSTITVHNKPHFPSFACLKTYISIPLVSLLLNLTSHISSFKLQDQKVQSRDEMATAETNEGNKPFTLYTGSTPNGYMASILLEELKAINPSIDYNVFKIDIWTNIQKELWFIKLNPNGRIPVLVDHTRNNFIVFETAAILLYLAQHYDKDHVFSFDAEKSPDEYSEMLQWIFFAHGGVGPMQGQSNHFHKYAPEVIPYAQNRYREETKRLYGVLEIRLEGRDWLAGEGKGKYSLADIKTFPWVRRHPIAGIETLDEFPRVKAWVERNAGRPGVKAGLEVPA